MYNILPPIFHPSFVQIGDKNCGRTIGGTDGRTDEGTMEGWTGDERYSNAMT